VKELAGWERHNIYLSRQVWGLLKQQAFMERTSASVIVDFILDNFLHEPPLQLDLAGNRSHNRDEDRLGRTIYFKPASWIAFQEIARRGKFSIASFIEALIVHYLGLDAPTAETNEAPKKPNSDFRYVQVGRTTFYLGESPVILDPKTGKPTQEE
jgi:hypothetical protein